MLRFLNEPVNASQVEIRTPQEALFDELQRVSALCFRTCRARNISGLHAAVCGKEQHERCEDEVGVSRLTSKGRETCDADS